MLKTGSNKPYLNIDFLVALFNSSANNAGIFLLILRNANNIRKIKMVNFVFAQFFTFICLIEIFNCKIYGYHLSIRSSTQSQHFISTNSF